MCCETVVVVAYCAEQVKQFRPTYLMAQLLHIDALTFVSCVKETSRVLESVAVVVCHSASHMRLPGIFARIRA